MSKNRSLPEPYNVAEAVEAVFGCKWSLRILELIRNGTNRPGSIEHALPGLSQKVQSHYFRRMMALGILERVVFPEVPPHVEYRLTRFGERFVPILDGIRQLQQELDSEPRRELPGSTAGNAELPSEKFHFDD